MKIVLIGLPQAGHQQLFSILTGIPLETVMLKPMEVQQGISEIGDLRFDRLVKLYNPKKVARARIEYTLLPDFNLQGPLKELIFTQLKNADEICFIVKQESAVSDLLNFKSEMVIYDTMLVEKRLDSISKEQRKKYSEIKEKEKEIMESCKKQLESEKMIKDLEFAEDQIKNLKTYQFFTLKPIFAVINVSEDKIKDTSVSSEVSAKTGFPCVQLCAELEEEISRLTPDEREVFMKELGVEEPATAKMTRMAYEGLGLISYFTVGEDEVKAWSVRKGAYAPEAGGVIHSDIEKGFVRAEMCKYDDLLAAGSEQKLKDSGKFYLKGRDYQIEDGDILNFRFNV